MTGGRWPPERPNQYRGSSVERRQGARRERDRSSTPRARLRRRPRPRRPGPTGVDRQCPPLGPPPRPAVVAVHRRLLRGRSDGPPHRDPPRDPHVEPVRHPPPARHTLAVAGHAGAWHQPGRQRGSRWSPSGGGCGIKLVWNLSPPRHGDDGDPPPWSPSYAFGDGSNDPLVPVVDSSCWGRSLTGRAGQPRLGAARDHAGRGRAAAVAVRPGRAQPAPHPWSASTFAVVMAAAAMMVPAVACGVRPRPGGRPWSACSGWSDAWARSITTCSSCHGFTTAISRTGLTRCRAGGSCASHPPGSTGPPSAVVVKGDDGHCVGPGLLCRHLQRGVTRDEVVEIPTLVAVGPDLEALLEIERDDPTEPLAPSWTACSAAPRGLGSSRSTTPGRRTQLPPGLADRLGGRSEHFGRGGGCGSSQSLAATPRRPGSRPIACSTGWRSRPSLDPLTGLANRTHLRTAGPSIERIQSPATEPGAVLLHRHGSVQGRQRLPRPPVRRSPAPEDGGGPG